MGKTAYVNHKQPIDPINNLAWFTLKYCSIYLEEKNEEADIFET